MKYKKIITLCGLATLIITILIFILLINKKEKDYTLANITTTKNDCLKNGNTCLNGTLLSINVNNTDKYNFYVINDDSEKVTLIMDHNIVKTMSWSDDKTCSMGPNLLISKLEEVTKDWTNIETKEYIIKDEENCYDEITKNLKARLLTKEEVENLGCKRAVEGTCPDYLFVGLDNNVPGYWLSSTTEKNSGLTIYRNGNIATCGLEVNCAPYYGLRLVIEVKK